MATLLRIKDNWFFNLDHYISTTGDDRIMLTGDRTIYLANSDDKRLLHRALCSHMSGPMLVAADWLEDHDFKEAAEALRKEFTS